MKNRLWSLKNELFILTVGIAALVHSTWSLGTLFSGMQPIVTADIISQFGQWLAQTVQLVSWLIPAFLISFSLDVGQIVTSHEIRTKKKSWKRYATFVVFSVATYYLQWSYMSFHMPQLSLSTGFNKDVMPFAQGFRDAAIWVIPALLPLSTFLYTFSQDGGVKEEVEEELHSRVETQHQPIQIERPVEQPILPKPEEIKQLPESSSVLPVNGYIVDWPGLKLWDPKYNSWHVYDSVQKMRSSINRLEKLRGHDIEEKK